MGAASRVEALLGPLLIVLLSSSSQEGLRELVASPSPKYHKVLTFISTTKSEGATVLTGGSLLEIVAIAVAFAHLVHCSGSAFPSCLPSASAQKKSPSAVNSIAAAAPVAPPPPPPQLSLHFRLLLLW